MRHQKDKQSKTSTIKIIAKLERTQSNAQENIEQTQRPKMEAQLTTNQQQQNRPLRTYISLSHWGH